MFSESEKLVNLFFTETYSDRIRTFEKSVSIFKKIIEGKKSNEKEPNITATLLLAGISLKSLISSFDRLSKGYLSDSETLLKKIIESNIAQIYLYNSPEESVKWLNNEIKLGRGDYSWKELSKKIDIENQKINFFETDKLNFFKSQLYDIGYTNACSFAHLDYTLVKEEMILKGDNREFSRTLILGPCENRDIMEITLSRLTIFTLFQISILKDALQYKDGYEINEFFIEVNKNFIDKL